MVHAHAEKTGSVSRWSSETRYKILLELNNAIVTCKSREGLFSALSKELQRHFPYDRLCIMLYDAKLHTITYFAAADGIQPSGIVPANPDHWRTAQSPGWQSSRGSR